VKGNANEFSFEGDASGQKPRFIYKGTVESATAMKGTAACEGSTIGQTGRQ
jgi:hypothetical protein